MGADTKPTASRAAMKSPDINLPVSHFRLAGHLDLSKD
jgi:hypothetical protein